MRKKYLYLILAVCVLPIFALSSLQLFISFSLSENDLRNKITEFFKRETKKAVKFESLTIGVLGDVTLNQFEMSMTSDFNDNLSLVKCENTHIDLQLLPLLKGTVRINGIYFHDADIQLYKRYGISYREFMDQFQGFMTYAGKIGDGAGAYSDDVQVRFVDSRIQYKEMHREKKTMIVVRDLDARIRIEKGMLSAIILGEIDSNQGASGKNGRLMVSGSGALSGDSIRANITLEDVDLTFANNYLEENQLADLSVSGLCTIHGEYSALQGAGRISGKIEADNCTVYRTSPRRYTVLMNDTIDVSFDMEHDRKKGSFRVIDAHLGDDNIDLRFSAIYRENGECAIIWETNEIDLAGVTTYFTPVHDLSLAGTLFSKGCIRVDPGRQKVHLADVDFTVGDCSVYRTVSGKKKKLAEDVYLSLSARGERMRSSCSGRLGKTDLRIAASLAVRNWFPLQSDTNIELYSRIADGGPAALIAGNIINTVYDAAYEEQKRGYDQDFFLKTESGKLFNNNNISLQCAVDRLRLGRASTLRDLRISLSLYNGTVTSRQFHCTGGGADYALNIICNLRTDQPYLKVAGDMKGYTFGERDAAGDAGLIRGVLNAGFEYELSFYRVSQVVENSKGRLNISLRDGIVQRSRLLSDLRGYFDHYGYQFPGEVLNIKNADLNVSLAADNYYISNSMIEGDGLIASVFGKYTFTDGYDVTVNAMMKNPEGIMQTVPLQCSGSLMEPCIQFKQKRESKLFCVH
ncbi:MAG: hypothetical protein JXA20_20210 [Spirochaetes bacterium]|nr:hypothetical protein [Spirochaetota bacterium]